MQADSEKLHKRGNEFLYRYNKRWPQKKQGFRRKYGCASAYPRAIDFEKLDEIAHGYGAYLMVDMAHIAGLVAGGYHQSPVPYADVVTTTTRSPFVTSGVRLGTPAVTTRGMGQAEMKIIADCIWHYDEKRDDISARVLALTKAFPLYE